LPHHHAPAAEGARRCGQDRAPFRVNILDRPRLQLPPALREKEDDASQPAKEEAPKETAPKAPDMEDFEKSNLKAEIADLQKLAQKQLGDYER